MPRPDRSAERRRELQPVLARAFAELGYRRATTAALAERCGVQEKALYRLWSDKRAMFLAALDQVFAESEAVWERLASERGRGQSTAERLLAHEAEHHGEHRLYRIVFAGLSETDDPGIRAPRWRSTCDWIRRWKRPYSAPSASRITGSSASERPAKTMR